MPKVVDAEIRRAQIVAVACQLIASDGIKAVTTRRIAEATGYSNGVLRYYFSGKDAVVNAAFQGIFDATNERARAADPSPRGLAGLHELAMQIMPLDHDRLMEARIAINFWQEALGSEEKAALHADVMQRWRIEIELRLREAEDDGELPAGSPIPEIADELLAMLTGLQVLACLSPAETSPQRQVAQYETFIDRLRR
ncbi:transcriptional regulator, TetR family [Agreia bicolorata]|uniref:TetR family transcriptional regulator n=1 Tax=Agreia bicolorata TaxID=110935 RepID=A0A1T4YEL2_9MICO|nr:TetR/AcrR family transcriptional regulator [Agreia bicolorata]KJC64470.1 TetR family transcriptional regulator [Agreia bicolorata]SKB00143.1 transcriptional regulator, TetR family [Agreia bicolorata]